MIIVGHLSTLGKGECIRMITKHYTKVKTEFAKLLYYYINYSCTNIQLPNGQSNYKNIMLNFQTN